MWQPLIRIACTGGIGQTDSNCNFNTRHCICNMVTCFSRTIHLRAMAGPYFGCLFWYYPYFVEWILQWLRFSTLFSDDTVFTCWKTLILQRLKPSILVTVCFTFLVVTKFFTTEFTGIDQKTNNYMCIVIYNLNLSGFDSIG